MTEHDEFAGVILKTAAGELVLQLRDDKPEVVDPSKLSLFAGRIEPGESPLQAAQRSLAEETTLRPAKLTFYKTFTKNLARHGTAGVTHIFVAEGIDPERMDVRQGQGYRVIADSSELAEKDTAPISYDIIMQYWRDTTR